MATGCYIPQYLPASFKGVFAEAVEAGSEHGRRGAEGEFPFSERTAYADLGRRIRTYSLRFRFVENSHIADANTFIAACESAGPGTLVHPTRGVVQAACRSIKVSDQVIDEQGVTYADADFVEANDWVSGFSLGASIGGISITGLVDAARSFFLDNYRPRESRIFRIADVQQTASDAIVQVRNGFFETIGEDGDIDIWRALSDIDFAATDADTLSDPLKVWNTVSKVLAATDARSNGEDKINIMRRTANWAAQSSDLGGIAGQSEEAVFGTVRMLTAAYITRGALESEPKTLDEALRQYDIVVSLLQQEIDLARERCDNCTFLEVRRFLSSAQAALFRRAYTLPPIVVYNFNGGVHALEAAYEIFDDAKRHREIENRNPYSWPWAIGPEVIAVRQ